MGILYALVFSIVFGTAGLNEVTPQDPSAASTTVDIVLHMKQPLISGNSVKLGYEIPYPGYIEFYLFMADGQKIWQNFGVKEKGEHYQAIRLDKLESGTTYLYEFWYKGKRYKGRFTA
ncbi:MAG: hypothetical protein AAGN35_12005 [Bacteroidota bacterium]